MDAGYSNNVGTIFGSSTTNDQTQTKKTSDPQNVNKDAFLQLLVAQLKNQDPLNPVDNQNFLAQLATFSSLEQLIAINAGITKLADAVAPADAAADAGGTATNTQPTSESKG